MADAPIPSPDIQDLQERFRKVKHDINNTLAVIMALAELGQRNPTYMEKLSKAVLQRGPEVVTLLQDYQALLNEKLGIKPPDGQGLSSGVFQ
jgi:SMC interacting uncharacterized protein involved in chromosome segregation